MIQVDKQDLDTFQRKNHVPKVISQTLSYEVKGEERWYEVSNMKIFKSWEMVHFGVSKKDPGLLFHFHVLNLCKCWSKLGLTKIQMSIKIQKKIKKMKNLRT